MLYTPDCYRWNGDRVSYDYLRNLYNFEIHEGDDGGGGRHIPLDAAEAWYPTEIREASAHAEIIFRAAASIRVIEPGYSRVAGFGQVNVSMNSQNHSYFGADGQKGLIGVKVEDRAVPSAYVDGLGICFGCHNPGDLPDGRTVGNNYMHVDITFGKIRLAGGSPPPAWPPAPTPPPISGGSIAVALATLLELQQRFEGADEYLRDILNGRVR